tara:strand:- start:130 stop:351 length:222 start_codon:yes stop_codon:yes gene_type:complete
MSHIKVEGHNNLVRDIRSNAIINNNKSDFQLYMKRTRERNLQGDKLRNVCKEINNLKSELREIKGLLTKVLDK